MYIISQTFVYTSMHYFPQAGRMPRFTQDSASTFYEMYDCLTVYIPSLRILHLNSGGSVYGYSKTQKLNFCISFTPEAVYTLLRKSGTLISMCNRLNQ